MDYVHWYNTGRLHGLLDYATPDEHEAAFYANQTVPPDGPTPPAQPGPDKQTPSRDDSVTITSVK